MSQFLARKWHDSAFFLIFYLDDLLLLYCVKNIQFFLCITQLFWLLWHVHLWPAFLCRLCPPTDSIQEAHDGQEAIWSSVPWVKKVQMFWMRFDHSRGCHRKGIGKLFYQCPPTKKDLKTSKMQAEMRAANKVMQQEVGT